MKIVVVSNSFYPEISPRSFRTTELVKGLLLQNHEVHVITNFHPESRLISNSNKLHFHYLDAKKFKPISVESKNKLVYQFQRVINFALNYFLTYPDIELVFLTRAALKKMNSFDALITIANPHQIHWGTAGIIKKLNCKVWIADCGDPFMGQENNSFKSPFYFKYVEKQFCSRANFITVPTEDSIKAYYPEFRPKIKVIPQGFNFNEVRLYDGPKEHAIPTFAYSGSFIKNIRDPKELLEFLHGIEQPYLFYIYTHKTHFNYVLPYIQNNPRVKLLEYIDRKDLLYKLSKMDFLVNLENQGKMQTPSKLIDYGIVGKPILSIRTGNLDEENVLSFINGNYEKAFELPDLTKYKIENVVQSFLDLIPN
jgi:glycosyltransferase involved in cell wall biosynthesis